MKHMFCGFLFANLPYVVDWLSKFVFFSCYGDIVVDTAVRVCLVFVRTDCPTVEAIILVCI